MPVTRDHAAVRGPWRRSPFELERGPGMPATAPQPRPRHLRPRDPAPIFDALRHRVLSTPANHNHPADRLPGARVAASCRSSLNLLENQGDRVFAHYAVMLE